jgi:hypothetical protein
MNYWNYTPEILYGDRSCTMKPVLSKTWAKETTVFSGNFHCPRETNFMCMYYKEILWKGKTFSVPCC